MRASDRKRREGGASSPSTARAATTLMNVKKLLTYAAVAFVVFYLFTQPTGAAAAVRGVFDGIGTGAERLSAFFTSLFSG